MKQKKRKINYKRIIIFLLIICIIGAFIYGLFTFPIKNIYVKDNIYLTDQEIIDLAEINNYPSFVSTTKSKIKKKLLKNPIIKSVNITKKISGTIILTVEENRPLFFDSLSNKYVLSNAKPTDKVFFVPILINSMPKEIYEKMIKALDKIEDVVLLKLSEIEYSKTEHDLERFKITTTDEIKIFVNIRNFEDINYYNKLLSSLEGKKGTWYLDYGDYFVAD